MSESGVYQVEKNFDKIDFSSEGLPFGEYEVCRFVNCNFEKIDLTNYKFIECEFEGCNLSLAKFGNTTFGDAAFKDCKMLGLHFEQCNSFGFRVRFTNCVLDHSSFYQVNLKGTAFKNTNLSEVDFTEALLTGAVFDNCDLRGAKFENTNLEKADFRTSYNYSIDPELNMLKKAKFSHAGLHGLLDKYNIEIS